jgi:hypothetical protein
VAEIGAKCFVNCSALQNFGISLQNLPKIKDMWVRHHFYSKIGSDLFIGCPFKITQFIGQTQ